MREFNTNKKDKHHKDDIYYQFNGSVYLVKHTTITRQYIGSGKTLKIALKDATESIKKYDWQPNYNTDGTKII